MWLGVAQLGAAALSALAGVVLLRVAVDLIRYGPEEIARRANPENWRDELAGLRVDPDGALRFKVRRRYRRGPPP